MEKEWNRDNPVKDERYMCKVIAVSCSKGGVGKTTSAVNIGIGLAYSGKRVLLLDVDGQGDLSKSLGVENPEKGQLMVAVNALKNTTSRLSSPEAYMVATLYSARNKT